MSRLKLAVDSRHVEQWAARVGNLVINFSAIELECIHWLLQLSEDSTKLPKYSSLQFATRARQVMALVAVRSVDKHWHKRSHGAWNQALHLAKLHNRIAHNPVVFAWTSEKEVGESDLWEFQVFAARRAPRNPFSPQKPQTMQSPKWPCWLSNLNLCARNGALLAIVGAFLRIHQSAGEQAFGKFFGKASLCRDDAPVMSNPSVAPQPTPGSFISILE